MDRAPNLGPPAVLREVLTPIRDVVAAYLYGSWARRYLGEPGPEPHDIDLLVVGQPNAREVYVAAEAASERLGRDVNPTILTEEEWRGPRWGFVREVRAGALVPVIGPAEHR